MEIKCRVEEPKRYAKRSDNSSSQSDWARRQAELDKNNSLAGDRRWKLKSECGLGENPSRNLKKQHSYVMRDCGIGLPCLAMNNLLGVTFHGLCTTYALETITGSPEEISKYLVKVYIS